MLKISKGNMYDWVTHTHSHLGGECPHKCKYCYVQRNRFGVNQRYQGKLRLIKSEFDIEYGKDRVIFIEHMNDLFANDVPREWIGKIMEHCLAFPHNQYVFQTKNPLRALSFLGIIKELRVMVGTTIETNLANNISLAPPPDDRFAGIRMIREAGYPTFITVEPVMNFTAQSFAADIASANPTFINIGADSKNSGLHEPSKTDLLKFIDALGTFGVTIRKKSNLQRLLK